MRNYLASIVVFVSGAVILSASPGCGDDTTSSTGGTTTSGPGTTTTAGPGSTGTGGTGGATTGTGGSGGAGGGVGGGGGAGGMGNGGAGGGSSGDHLVISELSVTPTDAEFVEIYNPTIAAVDLTNYYLSDNSVYFRIAAGLPWAPISDNPTSDFLVQFPPGTMLAPGAAVVVAVLDDGFEQIYGNCPNFVLRDTPAPCAAGEAAAMVVPMNGAADNMAAGFSNDREMIVLFHWDGTLDSPVEDVDYLTWGVTMDAGNRADKTGEAGYQPDTAFDLQKPAPAPPNAQSIERCVIESNETASGGNGIIGHDETSEDLGAAFVVQTTPTPGVKNACL